MEVESIQSVELLTHSDSALIDKLKEVFGYHQFRGQQEPIIQSILSRKDTFVIMPTGAGKSLCYQLPALMQKGTAIVVSPLIALMKNQVDQLNALGVNAQFLNSTLNRTEFNKVRNETLSGALKLLYVAPESLIKDENLDFLTKSHISFIAIDEAHCISEWGHDFRPEYRRLKSIIEQLGNLPIIALTATATPKVQMDIMKNLNMEDAALFKSSFKRDNLYYEVRPKIKAKNEVVKYALQNKGKSGIVYCLSRKKVEEISELLQVNGIRALPYHAGLDQSTRINNQEAFLNERADVVVATIAFGMGIDKPDVRYVIHYDVPKSLEGYYQETGRAGRDGLEGNCIMFYSPKDIYKLEKFNKDKSLSERENAKILLNEIASYSESSLCRVKQLLHYFGEHLEKDCGFCDNCTVPKEKLETMQEIVLAITVVELTEEKFEVSYLIDVLMGNATEYTKKHGFQKLDVWGKGKDTKKETWTAIFRQLVMDELLEKDIENSAVLKITDKGQDYLENPKPIEISLDQDFSEEASEEEVNKQAATAKAYDAALFDALKKLRKKVAAEKDLPPYVVFQDPSLEEMATLFPTTEEELSRINGVGMGKVQKFGKPFLELISKYVDENDIVTASDVLVKNTVNKSKIKIFIIQQVDRKIDLDEIADSKNISLAELIEEIEHICYSGTKLNIDYYINQVIEKDRQEEIYEYFMNAENDSMALALKEFEDTDYTEEELRLMRIKFLSEVAN
jgi:ATP-dependent DNA helicase RecQ